MERAEGIEILIPVDEDDSTVGPSDQCNEAVHGPPNWSPGRPGLHEDFARVNEGIRGWQRKRGKIAEDRKPQRRIDEVADHSSMGW